MKKEQPRFQELPETTLFRSVFFLTLKQKYLFCFWSCFFITFSLHVQESLAFMFEMAHLHEDALREYDELELCYSETGAESIP